MSALFQFKPHIKSIDNFKNPDVSLTLRRNRLLWKINIKKKNTSEGLNESKNDYMNTMDLNNNIKMQNIMYSDQDNIKSLKENKKNEKRAKKVLKKSLMRKMKSQKVYKRKRPKLYNIFALIDFHIEKKIFYRMCKIHNLIKGRNINKNINGIHQYKNIIIIFSLPLIIFASGAIFFPLKHYLFKNETYLPYGSLASSAVSLLILIYILRKILKTSYYHTTACMCYNYLRIISYTCFYKSIIFYRNYYRCTNEYMHDVI
ncbi:variable surface protein [Plasmodium gonderi]|uniref:Variable surface protein n=1 Tax=Plasmodium gonderi TaxID=77519 RepID=A0A1Y1JRQ1_PLAGO|nr:variable surface protein [Plasmodium gonderi]GAW84138.1 variable surface protein [Plasmodium gonderi]